jgi:hypothetical protein
LKYEEVQHEMRREDGSTLSQNTIVENYNYFCCVTEDYPVRNPLQLGEPGTIVEIDETVFVKRKYNVGMFFEISFTSYSWLFFRTRSGRTLDFCSKEQTNTL